VSPLQNPKTPKSTPSKDANGIDLIMGVDRIDMSKHANAASSNIDNGVAGLNILTSCDLPKRKNLSMPASSRRGTYRGLSIEECCVQMMLMRNVGTSSFNSYIVLIIALV
jgi:hypothetical protein